MIQNTISYCFANNGHIFNDWLTGRDSIHIGNESAHNHFHQQTQHNRFESFYWNENKWGATNRQHFLFIITNGIPVFSLSRSENLHRIYLWHWTLCVFFNLTFSSSSSIQQRCISPSSSFFNGLSFIQSIEILWGILFNLLKFLAIIHAFLTRISKSLQEIFYLWGDSIRYQNLFPENHKTQDIFFGFHSIYCHIRR